MDDSLDDPEISPDPNARRRPSPDARAGAVDVTAAREPSVADEQRQTALAALREAALRAAGVLPHPTIPDRERPRFWLRPSDQLVVAVLLAAATVLMTAHWVRLSDWGRQPVEIDRLAGREYLYRFDINRATWVEWAQLDGIGETLARRIVEDRQKNGPFRSVDDILRVRGIGRVRLEGMRKHLQHEPADAAE
jgi:competence protein ComEA